MPATIKVNDAHFLKTKHLVRIDAEFLELPAPFGVGIAEAFDVDAAREPPFDRSLNQLRREECE